MGLSSRTQLENFYGFIFWALLNHPSVPSPEKIGIFDLRRRGVLAHFNLSAFSLFTFAFSLFTPKPLPSQSARPFLALHSEDD